MWHELHKLGCISKPSNSVGTSPYSAKKAKKRIKKTMTLVLVGFFLKGGEGLPNIHFALDLLSSYASQNTGEYLRKKHCGESHLAWTSDDWSTLVAG